MSRFKHIPGRNGGKEDYPRKYSVDGDRSYRESKLWDSFKKKEVK